MYNETVTKLEQYTDIVEFERLCADILSGIGYRGIEPQSTGRRDGGKDALLENEKEKIVFHFSMRKDWKKKLFEDLDKVKSKNKGYNVFVFVTNRATTGMEKDSLKERVKNEYGMTLKIYDQEVLRVELDTNRKDIREKYLGIPIDEQVSKKINEIYEEVKGGRDINFEVIDKVAKQIISLTAQNHDSSEIQLPIDIKQKVSFNKLSSTFEKILKEQMTNFREIDEYLKSNSLNKREISAMLTSLKLLYLKYKHAYGNGDQIFTSMLDAIKPKKCSEQEYTAYCALLCYFFHSCEVFESVVP